MSAVLTVLFVVTGGWAAVRVRATARRGPTAEVVVELTHLVMSVAMIAMAWGLVTGPGDAGGAATLVVFGLVAAWALARSTRRGPRLRSAANAHHLVMALAMVWMVAAMPRLMATGTGVPAAPAMAGMPGMPGMPNTVGTAEVPVPVSGPSPWLTAATWLLVVLLAVAAALWSARAVGVPRSVRSPGRAADGPAADTGTAGTGACGGVALLASPVTAPTEVATPLVGRLDACCHALMSVGTAVMLVAMIP